jgi:hypothetical protein
MDRPKILIENGFLTVDDSRMRANILDIPNSIERPVSSDEFKIILDLGRESIIHANMYRLWAIRLGDTEQTDGIDSKVYTKTGYDNDTGIHQSIDEIQEVFHGYWHAIEAAGFVPEVRSTTGKNTHGSWMLLGSHPGDNSL